MLHVVKREDVSSISFHGCAWLSTKSPLERLASQTDTEIGRRANSVLYFGRQTFFCYVEIKCDSIKYVIQSSLVLLEIGAENDHSTGKKSKKRYSLYTWSCIMDHFRTIFFFFVLKIVETHLRHIFRILMGRLRSAWPEHFLSLSAREASLDSS